MSVPALRFKDDDGKDFPEWEEKILEELADVSTGNKDTQNKIDDGLYPFYVRSQTVERINSFAYDGEAILTSGDGVGVGKNFHYINGKFDYHQRVYCIFNFKNQVSGLYIFYYFSEKFYKRVMGLSAKNSVDSIRRSMITEMPISIPSLPEQTKIANFLTSVDEKISLLTQKADLLSQYKKGVMQQIFSQELRFKDDDGQEFSGWEEKTLGETVTIRSGISPSSYVLSSFDTYPFLKVEDMNNCSKYQEQSREYSNSRKNLVPKNSIIFPKRGAAILNNKVRVMRSEFLMDSNLMALTPHNNQINFEFLYYKLCKEQLFKIADTSSVPQINNKHILPYIIYLPSLPEQTKIANFLTAIDDKITNHQTQLNALKQYKQGLLQQLFV